MSSGACPGLPGIKSPPCRVPAVRRAAVTPPLWARKMDRTTEPISRFVVGTNYVHLCKGLRAKPARAELWKGPLKAVTSSP